MIRWILILLLLLPTQSFGIDNRTLNAVQREINILVDKREKAGILSNDFWEYQTMIDVLAEIRARLRKGHHPFEMIQCPVSPKCPEVKECIKPKKRKFFKFNKQKSFIGQPDPHLSQ